MREKLKKIEVNNYIREIQRIEEQLKEVNSQIETLINEIEGVDKEKNKYEEESKEIKPRDPSTKKMSPVDPGDMDIKEKLQYYEEELEKKKELINDQIGRASCREGV